MKMIVNGTECDFLTENEIGLINYGTYGNGSIDYGMSGIYAKNIAEKMGIDAVALKINEELKPLDTFITAESRIEFVTLADQEGQEMLSRTALFILSYALEKLSIPITRLGGYADGLNLNYSFATEQAISSREAEIKLEREINDLLDKELKIEAKKLPFYQVQKWLKNKGETELSRKIAADDDGGPVEGLACESFFEPLRGLSIDDLTKIKALKIEQLLCTEDNYTIKAKLILS